MSRVLFKFGTKAQYLALENKQENALYFLLDTGELYRGTIPFGQEHIYSGNRIANATDGQSITTILNGATPINNDLCLIYNSDTTVNSYVYDNTSNSWKALSLGSQYTDLQSQITALQAAAAGALHFKGTTNDLNSIVDPGEGDVYQVGSAEFAWNGTDWIELGTPIDLSAYATKTYVDDAVADLTTLIGAPAHNDPETGDPVAASGIYATIANHPENIIPVFNGSNYGLVPNPTSIAAVDKADYVLNAAGQWVAKNGSADIEWEELGSN